MNKIFARDCPPTPNPSSCVSATRSHLHKIPSPLLPPPPLSLSFSGVVNVKIEYGMLQWELPEEFTGQVSAYHVLVYRVGHRMDSPPMWAISRVYNLSNLHLAAGTYYIEVTMNFKS